MTVQPRDTLAVGQLLGGFASSSMLAGRLMLVLWLCGCAGRVAVAIQLRSMDAEVVAISRLLAVGALQVRRRAAHIATTASVCLVLGRAST